MVRSKNKATEPHIKIISLVTMATKLLKGNFCLGVSNQWNGIWAGMWNGMVEWTNLVTCNDFKCMSEQENCSGNHYLSSCAVVM